ncbi:hypothetical protein ACT6QH_04395 [Xanthobacter sp. TB0139]|uniref:hypothetical protein n=1 Tax=Xanthobacter sp. TB0139 TaxID=3459178 RepID=UPI004039F8B9
MMNKPTDHALPDDPVMFAAYVASISGELARISRENGLSTLAYILEMARLEARNITLTEQDASAEQQTAQTN